MIKEGILLMDLWFSYFLREAAFQLPANPPARNPRCGLGPHTVHAPVLRFVRGKAPELRLRDRIAFPLQSRVHRGGGVFRVRTPSWTRQAEGLKWLLPVCRRLLFHPR